MANTEKPPRYLYNKILSNRLLIEEQLASFLDMQLFGEEFGEVVDAVQAIPLGVPYKTMERTLGPLVGVKLTQEVITQTAWRIAGNLHQLKKSNTVPPYYSQLWPEWVPVQVIEVVKRTADFYTAGDQNVSQRVTKRVADLYVKVFAGLPAGQTIKKTFTQSYLFDSHTKREFGFSKYDKSLFQRVNTRIYYPLTDLSELSRMRFLAYIDPGICKEGPMFDKILGTSTTKRWNREMMEYRRRQLYRCPLNYDIETKPCYTCERGYDLCSAGCHPKTYTIGTCTVCKKDGQYMNPDQQSGMCVDCTTKGN